MRLLKESIMSYQIKDEDLQKVITLQLTAEQLEILLQARWSLFVLGLVNATTRTWDMLAEAQEAIIEVLESNFSVEV